MAYELKMLEMRSCFILLLVLNVTNAVSWKSLSKEVTKWASKEKQSSGSLQSLPLQQPLKNDENEKTGRELEIALITDQLGFVYCNVQQEPFMGKFVDKYMTMRQGHSAVVKTFDRWKLMEAPPRLLIESCRDYLQDAVLRDNEIRFFYADDSVKLITAAERVIDFDYFPSAAAYKFTVLQCPIRIGRNPAVKFIYFSAHGKTDEEGKARHYFVFADYTELDTSKFTILMRTVVQGNRHKPEGGAARVEQIKSRIYDHPYRCPVRLHVKPERFKDRFRLFGKDAEAAFLTEKFKFFNMTYSRNVITQFLNTVFEMRKGYEIQSYYEWIKTNYENQSISDISIPFDCVKYVQGAKSLQKYQPVFEADDNINLIEAVRVETRLEIIQEDWIPKFYQCPATFKSAELSGKAKVNVIPVMYKSQEKCDEHAFYLIIVNENTSKEHREFFFSPVVEPVEATSNEDRSGTLRMTESYGQEAGAEIDPYGKYPSLYN